MKSSLRLGTLWALVQAVKEATASKSTSYDLNIVLGYGRNLDVTNESIRNVLNMRVAEVLGLEGVDNSQLVKCCRSECMAKGNWVELSQDLIKGIMQTAQLRHGWTIVDGEVFCPEHSYSEDFDK